MKETPATGSWQKRFDYQYLGTDVVPENGKIKVTISKITDAIGAKVQGENKNVTFIYFKEFEKPMILGKENSKILTWNFGTKELQNWIGKSCELISDPNVKAFGAIVEALRFVKNTMRGKFVANGEVAKRPTLDIKSPNFASISDWLKKPENNIEGVIAKYDCTEEALMELKKVKL